jgi:hypothetical protein
MTDRIPLAQHTKASLDALYAEVDRLTAELNDYDQRVQQLTRAPADTDPVTPSRRAGLRKEIAKAIHQYDYDNLLSGNDLPSKHHRGEADAVLALLYREWPWLRAEAEDAAATEATELATTARITDLCDRWVKAGPPPLGTSLARWWDRRLAELHNTIHPPAPETEQNTTTKEN